MVRLVFRPYTQIRRTICTSVSLRASTRVSPGFTLFRHRSPSFGSQQICSYSNLSQANDRSIVPPTRRQDSYLSHTRRPLLSLRIRVLHPNTRIYVRLLGPCFKTGRWKPFRQHHVPSNCLTLPSVWLSRRQNFVLSRARPNRNKEAYLKKGRVNRLDQTQRRAHSLKRPRRDAPFHKLSPTDLIDVDSLRATGPPSKRPENALWHKEHNTQTLRSPKVNIAQCMTGFQRFPLNNFKYFLTLFSKFFSSFPHGTCSLSVSRQYLALDELYHPFSAALPSNATLRTNVVRGELQVKDGILTLYDTLFQRIYTWVDADRMSLNYNSESG